MPLMITENAEAFPDIKQGSDEKDPAGVPAPRLLRDRTRAAAPLGPRRLWSGRGVHPRSPGVRRPAENLELARGRSSRAAGGAAEEIRIDRRLQAGRRG